MTTKSVSTGPMDRKRLGNGRALTNVVTFTPQKKRTTCVTHTILLKHTVIFSNVTVLFTKSTIRVQSIFGK